MLEALWIVRQFPRQILRDLDRFHHRKLSDWWRGTRDADGNLVLSSYELLVYLEFMDTEGAFKTQAERGGRWPDWKQMLAEVANEGYRMRASYHAVHSTDDHDVRFDSSDLEFVDPVDYAERKELEQAESVEAAQTEPELAEIGWM